MAKRKTVLIGLGSKAQIGKDFACTGLREFFDVERIAFADSLKSDLASLFTLNDLDFHALCKDITVKEKIRPLMTAYGDVMREFNPDIWIDRAFKDKPLTHQVTIVTDVRFPNEVKKIKSLGGFYIDIQTDRPPANETEAYYSPFMKQMADACVENYFDETFIKYMKNLVTYFLDEHP